MLNLLEMPPGVGSQLPSGVPGLPFPILNKLIRFNGQRPFRWSLLVCLSNAKGVRAPQRTIVGQGLVRVHRVVAVGSTSAGQEKLISHVLFSIFKLTCPRKNNH